MEKNRTLLIVLAVVALLLLCCCGSGIAGLVIFRSQSDKVVSSEQESPSPGSDAPENSAPEEMAESPAGPVEPAWSDFRPATREPARFVPVSGPYVAVLDEAAPRIYPDIVVEETVLATDEEDYSTDLILVRGHMAQIPEARLAFYFTIEKAEQVESGWDGAAENGFDYMDGAVASNGYEYFWDNQQLAVLVNGITDPRVETLLSQVAADWPDGVVCDIQIDGNTAALEITRWEAYLEYSTWYSAEYDYDGTQWVYRSSALAEE